MQDYDANLCTYGDYPDCGSVVGKSASATLTVAIACFAQLKYRFVTAFGISTGYNHSFWWFLDSSNTHWVADGGPSSAPCPGNCGYLNAWVVPGNSGHYPADNSGDALAWSSAVSPSVCSSVRNLYTFALGWPQNVTTYYGLTGPNSNTFAHEDSNAAPFSATPPPNAPGW